ncbi:MAG: ATP-dependent DNA helicase [Lachnospirales bacterium]
MEIKISVRDLVEFVYRSGSIDATYRVMRQENALQDGIRLHNHLQSIRKKESKLFNTEYIKEKSISFEYKILDFIFNIKGRIDGIIIGEKGIILEEIKSTSTPLKKIQEPTIIYLSQLRLYGYIYSLQNNLSKIDLHLTYISVQDEETKVFTYSEDLLTLEKYFKEIIDKYLLFASLEKEIKTNFLKSSKKIEFPFSSYRKNQYELMGSVYRTIQNKKTIFIEAPTGTGKTISTLFPSIKALEQGITKKIFYATAKTITRQVAVETIKTLNAKGLNMPTIILTAKDKSCPHDKPICSPDYCKYAKGHFDRVNNGLLDILKNEHLIDINVVKAYSEKHCLCPHEFALDITNFSYCIICDYNNLYNPTSKLQRYFNEGGDYTLLLDEAHNLHDRGLDMFTTSIDLLTIQNIKQKIGRYPKGKKYIKKIEEEFNIYKEALEPFETIVTTKLSPIIVNNLYELKQFLDDLIIDNMENSSELEEFIFLILDFLRIAELFSFNYKAIIERKQKNIIITLQCIDVAPFLTEINSLCKGIIYFSATLTPMNFYIKSYGGEEDCFTVKLSSPFDENNCLNIIDDTISTYYKNRATGYVDTSHKIYYATKNKVGNYFVFFNSYEHLNAVYEIFIKLYKTIIDADILVQDVGLQEHEKINFLNNFIHNPPKTKIAFLVLGGMFSEGIDLVGDRLIGVIIVGVGLPKISVKQEIMKDYYEEIDKGCGFDYAYTYKGLSKILQAMGRLIRCERDKGFILLIDTRYSKEQYLNLLPFNSYFVVKTKENIEGLLTKFWE